MRAYPLIRRRWSNEHIMTALFAVLLLYMVPQWVKNPLEIPAFLAVLALGLMIDAIGGYIRYKRPVCSVSAAVTAGILQVMTPGIPLWGRLAGITAAIILGKLLWGGTGKNTVNPAITGYLVTCILFKNTGLPIEPTLLLLPALLFSLPFALFRPFASLGLLFGMLLAALTGEPASVPYIMTNALFLGCLVITDPVTSTPLKAAGFAGGLITGFLPLQTANPALTTAMTFIIFNLISYLIEDYSSKPQKHLFYSPPVIKSPFAAADYGSPIQDLTSRAEANTPDEQRPERSGVTVLEETAAEHGAVQDPGAEQDIPDLADDMTPDRVLERIRTNTVYGCGGAAFPAIEKINAVAASNSERKYFIINGAECDPGLVHDKWLLHNRAADIYRGILAVCRCMEFSGVYLAVKNAEGLAFPEPVRLRTVKDFFPVGFEKLLIENVMKMKLPDATIPADKGILVLNVQTVIAIYEAVFMNKKMSNKYITVADLKTTEARTVKVKTGDSIQRVIDAVFPSRQPVYAGGGIMQAHMADDDELVDKNTNFIAVSELPRYKESPFCSKCAACASNCPRGLPVYKIAELADEKKWEEAVKYNPDKCIRCGLCSYVCLSGRNLSARVGEAKDSMKAGKV